MEVRSRGEAEAFTTLDGSTIRVLLDLALGGSANQSLAEASLGAGQSTDRHYHTKSEEIYFFLEGGGEMEVEDASGEVGAGDAVLIPPGAWHRITAGPGGARFLCCCAPPYADDDTFFAKSPSQNEA
jgi:mannose-6-phosphate isomerase-like protein (cupin superfamily)